MEWLISGGFIKISTNHLSCEEDKTILHEIEAKCAFKTSSQGFKNKIKK